VRVYLETDSGRREAKRPHANAAFVYCPMEKGGPTCVCGGNAFHGDGDIQRGREEYRVRARCNGCGAKLGTIVTEVDTLFGIEEDERVLLGRCRVY